MEGNLGGERREKEDEEREKEKIEVEEGKEAKIEEREDCKNQVISLTDIIL